MVLRVNGSTVTDSRRTHSTHSTRISMSDMLGEICDSCGRTDFDVEGQKALEKPCKGNTNET